MVYLCAYTYALYGHIHVVYVSKLIEILLSLWQKVYFAIIEKKINILLKFMFQQCLVIHDKLKTLK